MTGPRTIAPVLMAMAIWTAACGDGTGPEGPPPPSPDRSAPRPTAVTVSPPTAMLRALGETVQLSAEVQDQNGNVLAEAVRWSSSDSRMAAVSSSGLVTAGANGTAAITATAGSATGSATVTVEQELSLLEVAPQTDTINLGDMAWFTAEAFDANGHTMRVPALFWASSDTLVALVDNGGQATSIGQGETTVTVTADGATGRAALTVVAPDGVVLPSTVWASSDVIRDSDPSAFDSLVYVGRAVRWFWDPLEGERRWRDDLDPFLFEAHFGGAALLEVQAHPALGEATAVEAARQILPPMGRLPRVLIDGVREIEVELSPGAKYGAGGNACANVYHWEGLPSDWRRTPPFVDAAFVEEIALHEGAHAVLDPCRGVLAEWQAAQAADGLFITVYARDYPNGEDIAETFWAWFVSRCVPDRMPPEWKRRIDAGIPHRLAYLDRLGLDMRPWPC